MGLIIAHRNPEIAAHLLDDISLEAQLEGLGEALRGIVFKKFLSAYQRLLDTKCKKDILLGRCEGEYAMPWYSENWNWVLYHTMYCIEEHEFRFGYTHSIVIILDTFLVVVDEHFPTNVWDVDQIPITGSVPLTDSVIDVIENSNLIPMVGGGFYRSHTKYLAEVSRINKHSGKNRPVFTELSNNLFSVTLRGVVNEKTR